MDGVKPAEFVRINTDVPTCVVWVVILNCGFYCSFLNISPPWQMFPEYAPLVLLYIPGQNGTGSGPLMRLQPVDLV